MCAAVIPTPDRERPKYINCTRDVLCDYRDDDCIVWLSEEMGRYVEYQCYTPPVVPR